MGKSDARPQYYWPDHARRKYAGRGRTRALVIGVSNYPGLRNAAGAGVETFGHSEDIEGAALSAWRFAKWLYYRSGYRNGDYPLESTYVLLSPTKGELKGYPKLKEFMKAGWRDVKPPARATSRNVSRALKSLAQASTGFTDDRLLVYLAGHGVKSPTHRQLLLLEDFAKKPKVLNGTLDVDTLENVSGFWPIRQRIFLRDMCRNPAIDPDRNDGAEVHTQWTSLGNPVTPELVTGGSKSPCPALRFHSTIDGAAAPALPPDGGRDCNSGTAFGRAVLLAANSAANQVNGGSLWPVTLYEFVKHTEMHTRESWDLLNTLDPDRWTYDELGRVTFESLQIRPDAIYCESNPHSARIIQDGMNA